MILLSENSEYKYFAIPVDKEAIDIYISSSGFICSNASPEPIVEYPHSIPLRSELLGVIGSGEEISETILNEVLFEYDYKPKSLMISVLAHKKILVENPIEKPERPMYINTFCGQDHEVNDQISEEFKKTKEDWQSYESRLVKAVILKVKK